MVDKGGGLIGDGFVSIAERQARVCDGIGLVYFDDKINLIRRQVVWCCQNGNKFSTGCLFQQMFLHFFLMHQVMERVGQCVYGLIGPGWRCD